MPHAMSTREAYVPNPGTPGFASLHMDEQRSHRKYTTYSVRSIARETRWPQAEQGRSCRI